MDFILGSLGEDGAIFASDLTGDDDDDDDEDGKIVDGLNMSERTKKLLKRSLKRRMNKGDGRQPTGSKVYFHRFETFGAPRDKDWLLTLPDGERVIGCACGEGWSAVVTRSVFSSSVMALICHFPDTYPHILFLKPSFPPSLFFWWKPRSSYLA
jgi:chromosome transmission fidelity protein 4